MRVQFRRFRFAMAQLGIPLGVVNLSNRLLSRSADPPPEGAIAAADTVHRHPDGRSTWIIVLVAHLESGAVPSLPALEQNLLGLMGDFPLMGSRLQGDWWLPRAAPAISLLPPGSSPLEVAPLQRFELRQEVPLRIATSFERDWLVLCAHHFAFDGLGMVALLRGLLTGEGQGFPDYTSRTVKNRPWTDGVLRLVRPADRIAPSRRRPASDVFASMETDVSGPGITARLAQACGDAARHHNARRGRPLRRLGLSVAVSGTNGESATYRRVDVAPDQDIQDSVARSLADPLVPPEITRLPTGAFLLKPVLSRFSDTLLVSNLGRLELPGVRRVEFYPVARGRSAVAVGAAGLPDARTTLTVRARDLDQQDAARFLEQVAEALRS